MIGEETIGGWFRFDTEALLFNMGFTDYRDLVVVFNSWIPGYGKWNSILLLPENMTSNDYDALLKDVIRFSPSGFLTLACLIPRKSA